MNGQAYALTVKDAFPKNDPLFVLAGLKPKLAKIGVAGGSFEDGKTIPLKLGKPVTLVNDATGARYSIKLVYLGSGRRRRRASPRRTASSGRLSRIPATPPIGQNDAVVYL